MEDVKTVVLKNGMDMQNKTVKNAVFTKGYSTGATKRSIRGETRDGGFTYAEGPSTHYAPYVEFGTRLWTHNLLLDLHSNNKYQSLNRI